MDSANPYQSPGAERTPANAEHGPVLADAVIEVAGRLSLNDFLAANRLSRSFSQRILVPWIVHPFLMLVALFLVTVVLGMWWFDEYLGEPFVVILVCSLPILLAVSPIRALVSRLKLGQLARQGIGCFADTQSRIDRHGIHVATTSVASTMKWEAFRGFRETQDVVVLYYLEIPGHWMVVSRAKFKSDGDWQTFRQLVMSKLRPI